MKVTITGIQEAQRANEYNIAQLKPSGALGRMVQYGTIMAHRYAVSITHVDTGALRASHRMDVQGSRGEIYLDQSAINPRGNTPTARYGPVEHARGGSHAFYERTEREAGLSIAQQAGVAFTRELR
jgi:hypothetical protein